MLHIFIGSPPEAMRGGATGTPVPGYEARVIDEAGREVAAGVPGRLAVSVIPRTPTKRQYSIFAMSASTKSSTAATIQPVVAVRSVAIAHAISSAPDAWPSRKNATGTRAVCHCRTGLRLA